MRRTIDIELKLQPTIDGPPVSQEDLYKQACSGDGQTVEYWRDIWIKNYKANKERFGSFVDHGIGKLFGSNRHRPAIVIGSGPSLRFHLEALKKNMNAKHPVVTVSCLHNFGLFEKEGIKPTYYLSLDSGDVVLDDAQEQNDGAIWDKTEGYTLISNACAPPKLYDRWKGKVYLFNSIIPDLGVMAALREVEPFRQYLSSGGNALGACMYFAKVCLGSDPIIFVGADFCFDYDHKFHSYPSKYDNWEGKGIGNTVRCVDIFGNARLTWPSYANFATWFSWVACHVPGNYVSCSEGILGAYPGGNIKQFKYMPLEEALIPYSMSDTVYLNQTDAAGKQVDRQPLELSEMFENPQYPNDLVLF